MPKSPRFRPVSAREHHGRVADPRWKHSFVKNALESRRDIVPVRFDGELSSFFYNLSNLRSALGIRANIEMLYLPDEMFRQKGRHFDIRFGEPVRWQSLRDAPAKVWAGRNTRHGIRTGERISQKSMASGGFWNCFYKFAPN